MNALIVEDDLNLVQALQHILEENRWHVDVAHDGNEGLSSIRAGVYDVIVLDIMLPVMNGLEVVSQIRREGINTPVLLLTALDAVSDKIKGLDAGADDYMTKPFSPAELLAHLRALTRRQGEVMVERLTYGDLVLDLESRKLSCQEKSIQLSAKEFDLMKLLMSNGANVLTKEEIINKVWGHGSTAEDNNIEAYVSFARKKLRFVGSVTKICTVRKVGYYLDALGK